ncbi:hypothetical protein [Rhodopseudomonas sp. BR0M22]|uniref:hypothetical protein n=1 Tax=Rhodopseudomonas sp. BR0M22 TaxID=2269369 RepID=UPI0013DEAB3E|nr:hypothetical protein [Rhodopseudomonas sp. BR0M22]NEW92633.1 hypothetical protein [Rhodopseudomonas sp. BR0M22]
MITTGVSQNSAYARPSAVTGSTRSTTASDNAATTTSSSDAGGFRIDVSQVKRLTGGTPISALDVPELRDMLATAWLTMQRANEPPAGPADNAPENTYAQIKVDGKVVATVYNSGVSEMSNRAAGAVGDLQDPPGLLGPNLAQWRAENYARRLGGTVEKASTAITQAQWKPRESTSSTYSREQLDAAFAAMVEAGQRTSAQGAASYHSSPSSSERQTDLSA